MLEPLMFLALLPALAESLILFVHPQWLARLAFLALPTERWFMLPEPKRVAPARSGYRDHPSDVATPVAITLPIARRPVRFDGAVLFGDPATSSYALRRGFGFIRRPIWLVRIEVTREDRKVTLRTKEAFIPITLPFIMLVFIGPEILNMPFSVAVAAVFIAVFNVQRVWLAPAREAAIERAFEHIERSMIDAMGGD
jgi:hypothetical protein